MCSRKAKTSRQKKRRSPRTKRETLYDSVKLESRLRQIPEGFQELFKDAYISARKLWVKPKSTSVSEGLYEWVDRLCEEKIDRGQPACMQGCAWCCQQDVMIAPFEFLVVREAMEKYDLIGIVRDKLELSSTEPSIETGGRSMPVSPCPLLEDDRCMIYSSRPIACRTQFSMNSETCRGAYEAARSGVGDSTYQSMGDPAVIGMAAREAVQAGRRIFLRDALREYLQGPRLPKL